MLELVEPGTTSETAVPVANVSKGKPDYVTQAPRSYSWICVHDKRPPKNDHLCRFITVERAKHLRSEMRLFLKWS
jgi:hypothetical protein